MCNANNFISSVQTSGIRIRSTGYSFKKALETKKIKTKICWHHFYLKGKKATYVFFVLIIRFREFGDENNTVIFQIISKFEQPNHLKHEKTKKNPTFFPFTPRIPPESRSDQHDDFCPDPDPQKMRIRNTAFYADEEDKQCNNIQIRSTS